VKNRKDVFHIFSMVADLLSPNGLLLRYLTFLYFWKQMYSAGGSVPRNEFKLISAGLNSPKLVSLHLMNQSYAATYTVRYRQFDMDSSNIKGSNHFSFLKI